MATNYVEQMLLTKDIIPHEFGVMFFQIVYCFSSTCEEFNRILEYKIIAINWLH